MIMLVDDDEEDAFVVRKTFADGRVPVEFRHVLGGEDLRAFMAAARSAIDDAPILPSVILLDINMPAVDGFQVLRDLRADEATRAIPVVMFTTSTLPDDVERAYREGANGYFVKPGSMTEMKKFVDVFDAYWLEFARLPHPGP